MIPPELALVLSCFGASALVCSVMGLVTRDASAAFLGFLVGGSVGSLVGLTLKAVQ